MQAKEGLGDKTDPYVFSCILKCRIFLYYQKV